MSSPDPIAETWTDNYLKVAKGALEIQKKSHESMDLRSFKNVDNVRFNRNIFTERNRNRDRKKNTINFW